MSGERPVSRDLLARLASFGFDVSTLLRRAGIPRSQLEGARPAIATRDYFALWRAADELATAGDVGLRLGSEVDPLQLSVATLAALYAPTLGEALERLKRYKRLACAEEITVDVRRGEARVGFRWLQVSEAPPPLLIDCVFSALVDIGERGSGRRLVPRRVELARPRAHEPALRRRFGCPIVFDAPADRVVLDAAELARPFRTRNDDLCSLLLPALDAAVEQDLRSRSLIDDVRAALRRRMTGEPFAIAQIASDLRLGARTLQRRLVDAGTTYQLLLGEIRRDTARRLLSTTDLSLGEVSFLLGFAEPNSFARAFRGWERTTPLAWRASATGTSAPRASTPRR